LFCSVLLCFWQETPIWTTLWTKLFQGGLSMCWIALFRSWDKGQHASVPLLLQFSICNPLVLVTSSIIHSCGMPHLFSWVCHLWQPALLKPNLPSKVFWEPLLSKYLSSSHDTTNTMNQENTTLNMTQMPYHLKITFSCSFQWNVNTLKSKIIIYHYCLPHNTSKMPCKK
jgi:hypothetical protein